MPQNRMEAAWRLGTALHSYFDRIVKEPLSERWVDLIKRLDEEERTRRLKAQQENHHD